MLTYLRKNIWIGRAQIENFGPIWYFLTQYIYCRSSQGKSFDGIMSIFHCVENLKKNSKVEKIHEDVPSISPRLRPEDWQLWAKTNIEMFLRGCCMSRTVALTRSTKNILGQKFHIGPKFSICEWPYFSGYQTPLYRIVESMGWSYSRWRP